MEKGYDQTYPSTKSSHLVLKFLSACLVVTGFVVLGVLYIQLLQDNYGIKETVMNSKLDMSEKALQLEEEMDKIKINLSRTSVDVRRITERSVAEVSCYSFHKLQF